MQNYKKIAFLSAYSPHILYGSQKNIEEFYKEIVKRTHILHLLLVVRNFPKHLLLRIILPG